MEVTVSRPRHLRLRSRCRLLRKAVAEKSLAWGFQGTRLPRPVKVRVRVVGNGGRWPSCRCSSKPWLDARGQLPLLRSLQTATR